VKELLAEVTAAISDPTRIADVELPPVPASLTESLVGRQAASEAIEQHITRYSFS